MRSSRGLHRASGFPPPASVEGLFAKLILLVWMMILAAALAPQSIAGTVNLNPGDDVPDIVTNSPAGTTFQFAAGLYRLTAPVVPLTSDTFLGASGQTTILSGAKLLTSFTEQNGYWTAELTRDHINPTCGTGTACQCQPNFPGCDLPEDLFIDGKILQRVTAVSDVTSGKWFWDLNAGTVYLADDPNGHQVEISTTAQAFTGAASNVKIDGLAIEKFASQGVFAGILNGPDGHGWTVENCTIRYAHLAGVSTGSQMQILNNSICDNGKLGILGHGDSNLIENNELCRNNYAGFFEITGGVYLSGATNLIVRGNNVHDNLGVGLHTDGESENVLYEDNQTARNDGAGIVHEISHAAIIRNNTSDSDVFVSTHSSVAFGSGIMILASDDVDVYGNTVKNSMNGIAGYQTLRVDDRGTHLISNLSVHDNVITLQTGAASGILAYTKDPAYYPAVFTTLNNHFDNNTYCLANPTGNYFDWDLVTVSMTVWQKTYGQDTHSILSCSAPTKPAPPADFSISAATGSQTSETVTPGQATNYAVSLAGVNGFSGSVSLACSGAPAQSTCAISPASVNLNGTTIETATITVSTTAASSMTMYSPRSKMWPAPDPRVATSWLLAILGMTTLLVLYKRPSNQLCRSIPLLAGVVVLTAMLSSCAMTSKGSASSSPAPPSTQPGTPAGNSTLVVAAASGALDHAVDFTLTVN